MEHNFNNRDFEHFVKQNADQYRMFPSEKVWRNVHATLHSRNRWYVFGLALLLLTAATVTWVMLIPSNRSQQLADKLPALSTSQPLAIQNNITVENATPVVITPAKATTGSEHYVTVTDKLERNLFIADIKEEDYEPVSAIGQPLFASVKDQLTAPLQPAANNSVTEPVIHRITTPVVPVAEVAAVITTPSAPVATTIIDESFVNINEKKDKEEVKETAKETIVLRDPDLMTIESVVNSYTRISKQNKFYLQAFFTPTISYRRLRENNQFISTTAARSNGLPSNTTLAIADVNSVVTHKPDIGLQLGVNGGYRLNKVMTVIAGLQFNVNKYDIRAYNYPSETATIALISGSIRTSSVSTETTYRNYSGSKDANWLHNLYFSASLPMGMEFRLSGRKKTEIGIGGTLQPTYVLGNRTYLLSTDYKNYAEVPSLVRKWNISTGLEAFAGYSTGKLNWRVGPQVRYQLMSSFRETYPVKEHLFDFGLKVGIMLNK